MRLWFHLSVLSQYSMFFFCIILFYFFIFILTYSIIFLWVINFLDLCFIDTNMILYNLYSVSLCFVLFFKYFSYSFCFFSKDFLMPFVMQGLNCLYGFNLILIFESIYCRRKEKFREIYYMHHWHFVKPWYCSNQHCVFFAYIYRLTGLK